jgi:tRNA (guanine-N7-)-methyltransferase
LTGAIGNSSAVISNQNGPHEKLQAILEKRAKSEFKRPISDHTKYAFDKVCERVKLNIFSIILDSGCGVGDSTIYLAQKYPHHFVVGLEKSAQRLHKARTKKQTSNMLYVRADQFDFWRLAAHSGWQIDAHFLFYPNPWPKKEHLTRRIHGHPAFTTFAALTNYIEVRSNWKVYIDELAIALKLVDGRSSEINEIEDIVPVSQFESKYHKSGQELYKLTSSSSEKHKWI